MNSGNFIITKLNIGRFMGLSETSVSFDEYTNVISGGNRQGKTTVCEFIRFMLYGSNGRSENIFPWDKEERVWGQMELILDGENYVLNREHSRAFSKCSLIKLDTGTLIECDDVGKYITGLNSFLYDHTIYFPQTERGISDVFSPEELDHIAEAFSAKSGIYCDKAMLFEQSEKLMNSSKTGEIDLLLEKRKEYESVLEKVKETNEKISALEESISAANEKMAENNKRMVILKADMKNYSDDIRLVENLENAGSLKNEILSNEKKCKYLIFEFKKIGAFPKESVLNSLKSDYSSYSKTEADINDAENKLFLAKENLKMHNDIFKEEEHSEDNLKDTKDKLINKKGLSVIFFIFSLLFAAVGVFAFVWLYTQKSDLTISLLVGISILVFASILGIASSMFKTSYKSILHEMNVLGMEEFEELYETFLSNKNTAAAYENESAKLTKLCEEKKQQIQNIISNIEKTLSSLGIETNEEVPITSVCESVISKLDDIYGLNEKIKHQKLQYNSLLSKNVEKETLQISDEFKALEKELSFISRQNESLFEKKTQNEKELNELKANLSVSSKLMEEVSQNEQKTLSLLEKYRIIRTEYENILKETERFENEIKSPVCNFINSALSHLLKPGESFVLNENFELMFKRLNITLPVSEMGGGLSRLAKILMKLAFTNLLTKRRIPLIFDESFVYIEKENIEILYRTFLQNTTQIIICSSKDDLDIFENDARLIKLNAPI